MPMNRAILIHMAYNVVCKIDDKEFISAQPAARYCSDLCRQKAAVIRSGRTSFLNLPTGTVGAIAEILVAADLLKKGYAVFRALSMSCFCDVIAIKEKRIFRMEIRTGYPSMTSDAIRFSRDTHGEIDCFGVYVGKRDEIFYFDATGSPIYL